MYQKYTDSGRQKGIVTLTPNIVDALTNEEQVKKIQALERGAAESTRLIENLWVQNCGLVKTIVHYRTRNRQIASAGVWGGRYKLE